MNLLFSRTALISLGIVLAIALLAWGLKPQSEHSLAPASSTVTLPDTSQIASRMTSSPRAVPAKPVVTEAEQVVSDLIARLKTEFAARIHDVAFQVSLKDMRDGLLSEFPAQGEQMFERIITGAFPALADEILRNIALMDD